MKTNVRSQRGFTLVEMLVVIAIIGVLAAILLPTIYRVVIKGKETRLAEELNQLSMSVETYKQKFGDYPPDGTNPQILARHLRRAFPNHREDLTTLFGNPPNYPDPSEALVFWLSRLKKDKRNPLTGNAELDPLYPFKEERLVDLDGDGYLSYVPQDAPGVPYIYFDSRTYATTSWPVAVATPLVNPYKQTPSPPDTATPIITWAKKDTFQIISAGLDLEFGNVASGTYKLFPLDVLPPAFTTADNTLVPYEDEDFDNITNFSEGKTLEDFIE